MEFWRTTCGNAKATTMQTSHINKWEFHKNRISLSALKMHINKTDTMYGICHKRPGAIKCSCTIYGQIISYDYRKFNFSFTLLHNSHLIILFERMNYAFSTACPTMWLSATFNTWHNYGGQLQPDAMEWIGTWKYSSARKTRKILIDLQVKIFNMQHATMRIPHPWIKWHVKYKNGNWLFTYIYMCRMHTCSILCLWLQSGGVDKWLPQNCLNAHNELHLRKAT